VSGKSLRDNRSARINAVLCSLAGVSSRPAAPVSSLPPVDNEVAQALRILDQAERHVAAGAETEAQALLMTLRKGTLGALARLRIGESLLRQGRIDDARLMLKSALKTKPDDVPTLFRLAQAWRRGGKRDEAAEVLRHALSLRPDAVEPAVDLARQLVEDGAADRAIGVLDAAIDATRQVALLHDERGAVLLAHGNPRGAESSLRRAVAIDPKLAGARVNLAEALADLSRHDEAAALLEAVIPELAEPAQARLNLAYTQFQLGRWREAWKNFEARFELDAAGLAPRHPRGFRLPHWRGEAIKGALFVWAEQGVGDEILYASLARKLPARGVTAMLECDPRLAPIFVRSFPQLRIVPRSNPPAPVPSHAAAQIGAGSLGGLLGWTAESSLPRPYLVADGVETARLRAHYARDGRRLVGLSWRSRNARLGACKTLALDAFEPILRQDSCDFIDLQYGDTDHDRTAAGAKFGMTIMRDPEIDPMRDLDGLAALIAACDVVVTSSNVTAHLAGALGVETHVLVPRGRGRIWYWFEDRADSPWYPRVRLHRQGEDSDWSPALAAIAAEIRRPTR
jgi:tetratricopeptide (TPR) repeat protein